MRLHLREYRAIPGASARIIGAEFKALEEESRELASTSRARDYLH